MAQMLAVATRHRMRHRAEIIDQRIKVHVQLFGDQRRADDPGIVGELEHLAMDRPGDRHRGVAGQRLFLFVGKGFERKLETGMLGGLVGRLRLEIDDATLIHFRNRKAGVGSANINRYNFGGQIASSRAALLSCPSPGP